MRRPDWPRVELGRRLQDRHAPALLLIGDGPVERGRATITNNAGMHDQAEIARRDLLGNCDLQHRRDDHVRRVARDGVHHRLARGHDANADFVAAFGQFDQEALAEAVMRGSQEKNVHGKNSHRPQFACKNADFHPNDNIVTAWCDKSSQSRVSSAAFAARRDNQRSC